MNPDNYFHTHPDYFWSWEEQGQVVSIRDGLTIAYREYLLELLQDLTPQGLPRFGSLLLVLIATGHGQRGVEQVESIMQKWDQQTNQVSTFDFRYNTKLKQFLMILAELPQTYREGEGRKLLIQALFQFAHDLVPTRKSDQVIERLRVNQHVAGISLTDSDVASDFKVLSLIAVKYQSPESIQQLVAGLKFKQEEQELELEPQLGNEPTDADLIEQLQGRNETYTIGHLVPKLWSSLHIPFHNQVPSKQPLGGVSDITNKGEFDRLLVSEFAHDNLVFLSRLANRESLYLNREIPPSDNKRERVFLLDVSMHNWGTIKTTGLAAILAIAKHPKTHIPSRAFAIGNQVTPLNYSSIEEVTLAQQNLAPVPHAALGLAEFLREKPAAPRELFLITGPEAYEHEAMQQLLSEADRPIDYLLMPDTEGELAVYRYKQRGKKHVQTLQLELEEPPPVQPKRNASVKVYHRTENMPNFPILLLEPHNAKHLLQDQGGKIYKITRHRCVFEMVAALSERWSKGWDLIYHNLPTGAEHYCIGHNEDGERILLAFAPQSRSLSLVNLESGVVDSAHFRYWYSMAANFFVFDDHEFFYHDGHRTIRIHWDASSSPVEPEEERDRNWFSNLRNGMKDRISVSIHDGQSSLKNVKHLEISEGRFLKFNQFELRNSGDVFSLVGSFTNGTLRDATQLDRGHFQFSNGSEVIIHPFGMAQLISANKSRPDVFLPMAMDVAIALATESDFAGSRHFLKEGSGTLVLQSTGDSTLHVIKELRAHLALSLMDARRLVEETPSMLPGLLSRSKLRALSAALREHGAVVREEIHGNHQTEMPVNDFYAKHIVPFIQEVVAHQNQS